MTDFLTRYVVAWSLYCVVAAAIAWRSVRIRWVDAAAFLRIPWKLALFVPAIVFVTFAGHFTDDETWDLVTGGGMSILTVLTSWWSVGTMVRVVRRQAPVRELVVASAVTLFSSSWFYDGYLLLRDGAYTGRWVGNLMISPIIYLCAGLVTNLELRDGSLGFAFAREDWPRPLEGRIKIWPLALAALPFIALAGYGLVGAVGWRIP